MKTRWMVLFLASVLSGGCVPANFVVPSSPPAAADKPGEAAERAARAQPVTAGQITAANAGEKASALRAEIDADMIGAVDANGKKDKK